MRLPICAKPLPDEFWQGYIMRLAAMNCCRSLEEFESRFIYGTNRIKRLGGGFPESLSSVCDRLADDLYFPGIEEAIAMTPYYAEIEGLPEGAQGKLAEAVLYDINEPVTPNYRPQKKFRLRVCPECMKKDIEIYGFWYFHLSHHLPDVCVCREHKVPLMLQENFEKRRMYVPDLEKGKRAAVPNMEAALLYAEEMEKAYEKNKDMLRVKKCPGCGKEYLVHPYSERTGAGCPFCRRLSTWESFIQRRLELIHGEEYALLGVFSGLSKTIIKHILCGQEKKNLEQLLWDKRGMCSGCKALTVSKIQKMVDPYKEHFIVTKSYRSENDASMISAVHLDCGRSFDMQKTYFIENSHCPLCERELRAELFADLGVPGYSIVSTYYNNREQLLIRHHECGCIFRASKTAIIAGTRCRICTNRYDFQMVSDALAECTDGYTITKSRKRGVVTLYYQGNVLLQETSYAKIMNDLQAEDPEILTERKKKYCPPRSIRKRIYDAVAKRTKEKGFWEGRDMIDGEEYTRVDRNILQDLANLGYVTRIEKGRYKTNDELYKCYDGDSKR